MFGLTIPFAIDAARRNPTRESVRDVMFSQGDDVTFAVTAYAVDGSFVDISGGAIVLTVVAEPEFSSHCGWYGDLWGCDYGLGVSTYPYRVLFQAEGVIVNGIFGEASITIPSETTALWRGRYLMTFSLADAAGGAVRARGALQVRPSAILARLGLPGYVSISDGVLA